MHVTALVSHVSTSASKKLLVLSPLQPLPNIAFSLSQLYAIVLKPTYQVLISAHARWCACTGVAMADALRRYNLLATYLYRLLSHALALT